MVVEAADRLVDGPIAETPQDHARNLRAEDRETRRGRLRGPAGAADPRPRSQASQPWPLVSVLLGGKRYLIHRTEVTGRRTNESPGSVLASDDRTLEVATGDGGVLRIVEIQPEGKRAMAAREFLAGHPLAAGARFEQP